MNNKFFKAAAAGIILSVSAFTNIANAGLIDRGNGMIYDDVQDITWLQDANYAMTSGYDADGKMTWHESIAWAAGLEFGGYDDWRLFDAAPSDEGCSHGSGDENYGFNCLENELGHLYYSDFGLTANQSIDLAAGDAEYDLFTNVQSYAYWSGTAYSSRGVSTILAWGFGASYGGQDRGDQNKSLRYAWAVRDGDVSRVPEPTTLAIFGLGLLGLVMRKRAN
ncbi:MAG: PEP-CTERM sorting domain-containing protein [Alteromonadales bacterium]|nr:PEP-CTERM sorting domain-containing protein [Alteromonadales bacterium]MCP4989525.1 PEP-CTERM sorting domain-containing protein [Colwellia sp.]